MCPQRCITVHGTHGVTVADNVAYNTFGHCYFLEDGGEKNNTFHHNLGLVTKVADTIPSDRMPATFWVTSPLNTLTENSAAGSEGMGIWYIFADKVTIKFLMWVMVVVVCCQPAKVYFSLC